MYISAYEGIDELIAPVLDDFLTELKALLDKHNLTDAVLQSALNLINEE